MAEKVKIEVGQRFGHWKVLGPSEKPYYLLCQCEKCGVIKDVHASALRLGKSSSCPSCARRRPMPETTKTFLLKTKQKYEGRIVNNWHVLEVMPHPKGEKGESFLCRAICPKCGKETTTRVDRIKSMKQCAACAKNIGKKIDAIHKVIDVDGSSLAAVRSRLNGKVNRNSSTGYNGVATTPSKRYRAYINFKRKQISLGVYDTAEKAAKARKEAEKIIYGEFLEENFGWEDRLKEELSKIK